MGPICGGRSARVSYSVRRMGRLRLLSGGCLLVMLGALPRDCAGFQAPIVFNSLPFAGSRCGSFSLPRLAAAGTNTRSRLRSRESSVSLLAAAKDRAAGDFPDRGDGKKEDQDMDPGSPELQLPAPDSSGRIASMKQPKQPKTSLGRASVYSFPHFHGEARKGMYRRGASFLSGAWRPRRLSAVCGLRTGHLGGASANRGGPKIEGCEGRT